MPVLYSIGIETTTMEDSIPTDLIIRYLSNEATTEEAEKLLEWVAADKSNQKIFNECVEAWKQQFPLAPKFEVSTALKRLNERIDQHEQEVKSNQRSFSWVAIAASVTFLIVAASAVFISIQSNKAALPVQYVEIKTPTGGIKSFLLSDSTKVTLNEESTLTYPASFTSAKREVSLIGEAFFEVKRDSLRPFIVKTGEVITQVLGTSFNVQTLSEEVVVAVATGKVRVSKGQESLMLLPAEKATYVRRVNALRKERVDLASILSWRNPPLIFHDTPLTEVAAVLEKKFNVVITFEKESLQRCVLTGKFKTDSLEKVLTAIGFSLGIRYSQSDNQIYLSGNGCN